MQSFQIEQPLSQAQMTELKTLFACDDLRILTKAGGGNSKVFCIEANSKKWAVKFYPPYTLNQRDRLATECMVYQFLNQHKIETVPKVANWSFSERFLVLDWIEGHLPDTIESNDVEQAISFIQQVAQLNSSDTARALPDAAEAFLSLNILISQITKRFQRLRSVGEGEEALQAFLSNAFSPLFEHCQHEAYKGYHQHQINPNLALPEDFRSLIPADFGFHNAIRDKKGRLYFFDFDYFGWDDPVKLLADILWHPKMALSSSYEQQFINGIAAIYSRDHLFLNRFRYTLPLFGLRWVLILLNEFIPEVWKNRQHAEVFENELVAKQTQLTRAKNLLKEVLQKGHDHERSHTSIL
jgi:hypothetical protein